MSRPHSGHRHRPDDVLQAGDAGALERDGRKALRPAIEVDAGLDAFEERPVRQVDDVVVRPRRAVEEQKVAQAVAERMAGVEIEIARKVGETEALYGSVTSGNIAEALAAKGFG